MLLERWIRCQTFGFALPIFHKMPSLPTCPADPAYWLTLMESVCKEAVSLFAAANTMAALRTNVATLILHSCRATLLNAHDPHDAGELEKCRHACEVHSRSQGFPAAFSRKMAVEFGAEEEVPELLQLEGEALSILGSPPLSMAPTTRTLTEVLRKASDHRAIEKIPVHVAVLEDASAGSTCGFVAFAGAEHLGQLGQEGVPLRTLPEALSGARVVVWARSAQTST